MTGASRTFVSIDSGTGAVAGYYCLSASSLHLDGAPGSEFNGGAGYFVEAEYGHHPGITPNGSTTTPPVWPWCNKEYPIANFGKYRRPA